MRVALAGVNPFTPAQNRVVSTGWTWTAAAHGSARDGTIKTPLSWGDATTNRAQTIIVYA